MTSSLWRSSHYESFVVTLALKGFQPKVTKEDVMKRDTLTAGLNFQVSNYGQIP